MALIELNRNPEPRQLRLFGILFFPLFCLMVGWILWRAGVAPAVSWALWGLGALSVPVGALAPRAIRPVWIGTMLLTFPIGFVISHVLLAVVYYLVLTPVGLLMRACGRDPMLRRFDPAAGTHWVKRPGVGGVDRYFRQF